MGKKDICGIVSPVSKTLKKYKLFKFYDLKTQQPPPAPKKKVTQDT